MKQLDYILDLRRDILSIEERIVELRQITQPKAQVLSDMPRGGGERKNLIEEYVIKSEKLNKKLARKKALLDSKWEELIRLFDLAGVSQAQRDMMTARFYYAKPWKACVKHMRKKYPDAQWNEQKCFRVYRKILYKINKI